LGLLACFTYKKIIRKIKLFGFEFDRQAAGSHEIWWNPITRLRTTIPNHPGDLPEGTVRAILRQANISPRAFLQMK
jgi:predicted RNA binding protein YcfA (HicA-like mRNA interferase family)